ncbi:MAG TPA: hypothetical protein VFT45_25170 [Longimicrobium sp.]|nr:hypothetical protein [Longimicrobium sp.]
MSATATLTTTARPHLTLRRIGAVFAGLLTIVVLSTAADAVLHATGVYPPFPRRMADGLFLLATAYRIVFGIAAGYVTARLAPDQPMRHALALGLIGVALSTAGAAAMWEFGPGWYSLAIIAIALPCAWTGARLHAAQLRAG